MSVLPFVRRWIAGVLAVVLVASLAPAPVAAAAPEPTAVSIGAPTTAELGQRITLQARLVDSAGAPIGKATVVFTSAARFLNREGDVEIARATTDGDGLAVAEWQVRRSGTIAIRAEFRGSERYAPAQTMTELAVEGSQQLYVQDEPIGVQIPGLSAAMPSTLWSRLSGWPIALVLVIVWSLYAYVVSLMLRVWVGAEQPATSAQWLPRALRASRVRPALSALVQLAIGPRGAVRQSGGPE